MKYMGSKARLSRHILPIMLDCRGNMDWVEPFVGGGNTIDKVSGRRIGFDIDKYTIQALISIRDFVDELPRNNTEFTELQYKNLRNDDSYKHKGFAGYAYSYGGKWMGGWRRDSQGKRDYINESYRNARHQSILLQGVELYVSCFSEISLHRHSLIYCDPPYAGTTGYKGGFDHDLFFETCRKWSADGHKVFVSEYNAPPDFECVYECSIASSLTKETGAKKGLERLFTL